MQLNEQQQALVDSLSGYICCVACPGSGKSTSILARTNALVRSGVPEAQILLMTFTNEAATHMRQKYMQTYGKNNINFGTMHSFCFRALCELRGLTRDSVISEVEKWEYIGKIIKDEVPFNQKEDVIRELISQISFIKNKMITPEEYDFKSEVIDKKVFSRTYYAYENYKQMMKKIDFDDMLLIVNTMLEKEPIAVHYFQQWQHIMVDEYQDTNRVQASVVQRITLNEGFKGSLAVVGDDDQSIYGFRSADSSIMLDFQKNYPNAKILYLDTNYRSEPEIVEIASSLIKNNTVRFDKNFKASRKGKADIDVKKFASSMTQINAIIEEFKQIQENDMPLQEVAVLYRINKQGDLLASRCIKEDIPFYSTENIQDIHSGRVFQDILCYYRISRGIEKNGDLQAILNRPSRYLASAVFKNCRFDEKELINRCSSMKNRKKAEEYVSKMINDINILGKIEEPERFVDYLYNKMGYVNSYVKNYCNFVGISEDEAMEQLEVIKEEALEYEDMNNWIAFTDTFAEKLKEIRKKRTGVCLSTYHASKGLEWDIVYLIDCNEGITPYKKAETDAEVEEERRMFYVAFTRAKSKLQISYIESGKETKPSMFLNEMGLMERVKKGNTSKIKVLGSQKGNTEKMPRKYYAICSGRETGVVDNWEDCLRQIDGYKGAYFRSFARRKSAENFIERTLYPKNDKQQEANGKFYAVKEGIKIGIYNTWEECKKQIDGYSGAKYRSFVSKEEAEKYLYD